MKHISAPPTPSSTPVWALATATLTKGTGTQLNGILQPLGSSNNYGASDVTITSTTITVASTVPRDVPVIVSLLDPHDGFIAKGQFLGFNFLGINIVRTNSTPVDVGHTFPFFRLAQANSFTAVGLPFGDAPWQIDVPAWISAARAAGTLSGTYGGALTWLYRNNHPTGSYSYNLTFSFTDGSTNVVWTWDPTEEADH